MTTSELLTCLPHILTARLLCLLSFITGTDEDRWTCAVYRLHATIFQGYRDWCAHVDLPEKILQLDLPELRKTGEAVVGGNSRLHLLGCVCLCDVCCQLVCCMSGWCLRLLWLAPVQPAGSQPHSLRASVCVACMVLPS